MTTDAAGLRVVPTGKPNLNDIPGCLRNLADRIERGEVPCPRQMIAVGEHPEAGVDLWVWGDCPNKQQMVGLLTWGIHTTIHDAE